jgi:hypothetical protein
MLLRQSVARHRNDYALVSPTIRQQFIEPA